MSRKYYVCINKGPYETEEVITGVEVIDDLFDPIVLDSLIFSSKMPELGSKVSCLPEDPADFLSQFEKSYLKGVVYLVDDFNVHVSENCERNHNKDSFLVRGRTFLGSWRIDKNTFEKDFELVNFNNKGQYLCVLDGTVDEYGYPSQFWDDEDYWEEPLSFKKGKMYDVYYDPSRNFFRYKNSHGCFPYYVPERFMGDIFYCGDGPYFVFELYREGDIYLWQLDYDTLKKHFAPARKLKLEKLNWISAKGENNIQS